MGGWDLLEIGDNATIGREASLHMLDYDKGELIFDNINVDERSETELSKETVVSDWKSEF